MLIWMSVVVIDCGLMRYMCIIVRGIIFLKLVSKWLSGVYLLDLVLWILLIVMIIMMCLIWKKSGWGFGGWKYVIVKGVWSLCCVFFILIIVFVFIWKIIVG